MPRIIVLSTCGSMKEARKIAKDLLHRKLAACVNITPVYSYFRWKKKVQTQREYLLLIKTRSQRFVQLRKRILALHSYELPEIVIVRIAGGHSPYLEWIDREVPIQGKRGNAMFAPKVTRSSNT
jgi:periplasmic divalent cation tolerance protein